MICSLGIAISSPEIVQVLNNIKAPYNVSTPTASLALRALSPTGLSLFRTNIQTLIDNRTFLLSELPKIPGIVGLLGAHDANFVLAQVGDAATGRPDNVKAKRAYTHMAESDKVVVRFRGTEFGCEGALRITVGTRQECEEVLRKLSTVLKD